MHDYTSYANAQTNDLQCTEALTMKQQSNNDSGKKATGKNNGNITCLALQDAASTNLNC